MSGRQSAAVDAALALIGTRDELGRTITAYRAAVIVGISLSTIYRAIARSRAHAVASNNLD